MRVGRAPTSTDGSNAQPRMQISIVIPTRDRPAPLARCLAALGRRARDRRRRRRLPRPRRGRRGAPSAPGARRPRARGAARRPRATSAPGRRRGDVVCFTDDDCEPEPAGPQALARGRGRRGRGGRDDGARRRARAAAVRASQAIVEHLTLAVARPGDRPARLRARAATSRSPARRSRAALRRALPGGGRRGPRLERPRRGAPASRPCTSPDAVVVHRQELGAGRLRPPAVRLRARRGRYRAADPGGGWRGPGFYAGLVRRGFGRGGRRGPGARGAGADRGGVVAERLGAGRARATARPTASCRQTVGNVGSRAPLPASALARAARRASAPVHLADRRGDVDQPRRPRSARRRAPTPPGTTTAQASPGRVVARAAGAAPVAADLAEARRVQRGERGRRAVRPSGRRGRAAGPRARPGSSSAARTTSSTAGAPSGSAKSARPGGDLVARARPASAGSTMPSRSRPRRLSRT